MSLSDYLPDFSDPSTMAMFGALGNVLTTGAAPRYDAQGRGVTGGSVGNALATLAGAGMQGAVQGAQGAQAYQGSDIANQVAQLGLQRQQALQPLQLSMMKNAMGGAPGAMSGAPASTTGGAASPADAQFAQAYQLAMMTGDMGKAAAVLQSWAEHNPQLAGAIENAKQQNTFQKTPQGTYAMPSQGIPQTPFGSPAPAGMIPPSGDALAQYRQQNDMPTPPVDDQRAGMGLPIGSASPVLASQLQPNQPAPQAAVQRDAAFMPPNPQPNAVTQTAPQFAASDGKTLIPSVKNAGLFKSDPSGLPAYNTPNTETGVAMQKDIQKEDLAANAEMTSNMSSIQKEQYRLKQLVDAYKGAQSGTFMAQYPDVAKGLVAAGLLDPSQTHNLSLIQKAIANQAIQVIQQTKDANANLGEAPMRMFGSELANMQKKAENPSSTPEGNFEVITDAMGLANHAADMYKGWDAIGGLGNRLQNGTTLRPANYAREFIQNHDPQDYKEQAMKQIGEFKGQPQAASKYPEGTVAVNPKTGHSMVFKGGQWQ